MNKYTKAGLTALAGSLVAMSAAQADFTASGSAKMSYTSKNGAGDAKHTGNRFGMDKDITVAGSMEMDNGWTVSTTHTFDGDSAAATGSQSALTVDMGAMGAIKYQLVDGALGIGIIDDVLPTADEETWNGITGASGRVSVGANGFNYSNTVSAVSINIGYVPAGSASKQTGTVGAAGAGTGTTSIALSGSPMDGLTVYAGTGSKANATSVEQEDDLMTYAAKYAYGPVTVGYQFSEYDTYNSATDFDTTGYSIAYAINDNLSISYAERTVDIGGNSVDEEQTGMSIGYSMGGMTIKAHNNVVDNVAGAATDDLEHMEIAVSFAF
jgi:outer membrane protein OmpU